MPLTWINHLCKFLPSPHHRPCPNPAKDRAVFQLSDIKPLQGAQHSPGQASYLRLQGLPPSSGQRDVQGPTICPGISTPPASSCPWWCPSDTWLGVSRVPEMDPFITISVHQIFPFCLSKCMCNKYSTGLGE